MHEFMPIGLSASKVSRSERPSSHREIKAKASGGSSEMKSRFIGPGHAIP